MTRRLAAALLLVSLAVPVTSVDAAPVRRCPQYEPLLRQLAPKGGWDVKKMSGLMWRESRCKPMVRSTTRDTGLLQINDINHRYLSKTFRTRVSIVWLKNARNNIRAAAALCTYWRRAGRSCYRPWGAS